MGKDGKQKVILNATLDVYRFLFARRCFYRLNNLLLHLHLRSMGILNWENDRASGQCYLMERLHQIPDQLTILDVGANVGNYSVAVRKSCPSALIFAFEPHPKTFLALEQVAKTFGFHAINAGCSDSSGLATIFDYSSSDGSEHASLHRGVIESIHQSCPTSHEVRVTTVDEFLTERGIQRIDLLKIDTEGHEYRVLLGARDAIKQGVIGAIHFEFNEMNVISRTFFRDFYVLLAEYKFFRMLPSGFVPMGSYYPATFEIFAFQNILALRSDNKLLA